MTSCIRLVWGMGFFIRGKLLLGATEPPGTRPRALSYVLAAVALGLLLAGSRAHAQAYPTPTGLTTTTVSSTQIKLTWNAVGAASGYVIYRSDVTGPVGTVNGTSFVSGGLQPGTSYTYTVASADCGGDPASPQSAGVAGQTYPLPVITVSASATPGTVSLSWTATDSGGPGIANYSVYRGSTLLTPTPVTTTTYIDSGLSPGSYTYTVKAFDTAGDAGSGTASVATYPAPTVSASASPASATSISITWSASDTGGPGIQGYRIYRGATLLTSNLITSTSYTDTGLTANTGYTYTVKVYDTVGGSGSATTSATTYTNPTVSVSASAASVSSMSLSWTASDTGGPGIKNYNVYRSGTLLTGAPITATTYTDSGLSAGVSYTYTVVAYDMVGDSASGTATASTYPTPGVTVSASTVSSSSIALSWTATDSGGPGIARYNVYRNGSLLTTNPITTTSYTDTGLSAGTSYTYTVNAYDTVGDVGSGSVARATYPLPSVSVSATAVANSTSVTVSWSASDSGGPGIANYNVYRSGTLLTSSPITSTSYTDSGTSGGTSYSYTVTAYDTAGDAGSGSASVTTLPAAPVLRITPAPPIHKGQAYTISWAAVAGNLNHYTYVRNVDSVQTITLTLPPSTLSQSYTGGSNTNTFQVRACVSSDDSQCSAWSNTITVISLGPSG